MSNEPRDLQAVMEGKGAYNKYATLQAAGGALALPLLEKAALEIDLGPEDAPIVIADYGSSQGKNSLAPMRTAIATLRTRIGPNRPIIVFHTDQPGNDFNTLFETLNTDPDRYAINEPGVFACAIGRSFYGNVLPPHYVHLGWSAYAAVWLSRIPMTVPDHFRAYRSAGAVRAEFDRQGAQDWETFLSLRAGELREQGRLVVVLPALDDDQSSGLDDLLSHANAALAEMVGAHEITQDERARMTLAAFYRRQRDLLAPFAQDGQFRGLIVEQCTTSVIPHSAWLAYERHGDKAVLATDLALFFRSTFVPSLRTALAASRGASEHEEFGDRLEGRLKRRLIQDPTPARHHVSMLVVAKRAADRSSRGR